MLDKSYFVVSLKQGFPTSIYRIIFLQSASHIAIPYENINLCSFSPASTGVYNNTWDRVMSKTVCIVSFISVRFSVGAVVDVGVLSAGVCTVTRYVYNYEIIQ
ncbi:hypothetical protein CEXT_599951 [Caerostris extrusa]|uniref:Uncharacterized protein n=1 Tax=Caerostris extrusa TaxID=172846 RepID=A0AAV4PHZ2_CAEEX|nr:hypothetical protein CEXT_599951 [Caerostris extrusa]